MTKHEHKIHETACCQLFEKPTPTSLIDLLLTDPSFLSLQSDIGRFIASPDEIGLAKLVASCRSLVDLNDALCRFRERPTLESRNELLTALPSLNDDRRASVGLAVFLARLDSQESYNVRWEVTLKQARRVKRLVAGHGEQASLRMDCGHICYLRDEETRRIATRMMNSINKSLFGNAARHKPNPRRLSALVCQHDHPRKHLHFLIALPSDKCIADLQRAFGKACRQEPFVYHQQKVDGVRNLAGSIIYNANDAKTRLGDSIVYLYPQTCRKADMKESHHHEQEQTQPAGADRPVPDDGYAFHSIDTAGAPGA